MFELSNNSEGSGAMKATLIAKIDKRAVPALDRIATTNQVNTDQLMTQLFSDIANAVEFLDAARGGSLGNMENWFARLIAERCRGATPEALRAMGRIWNRAAELRAQEGVDK